MVAWIRVTAVKRVRRGRCILQVELTGLAHESNVGMCKREESRIILRVLDWITGSMAGSSVMLEKAVTDKACLEKKRSRLWIC